MPAPGPALAITSNGGSKCSRRGLSDVRPHRRNEGKADRSPSCRRRAYAGDLPASEFPPCRIISHTSSRPTAVASFKPRWASPGTSCRATIRASSSCGWTRAFAMPSSAQSHADRERDEAYVNFNEFKKAVEAQSCSRRSVSRILSQRSRGTRHGVPRTATTRAALARKLTWSGSDTTGYNFARRQLIPRW